MRTGFLGEAELDPGLKSGTGFRSRGWVGQFPENWEVC